MTSYDVITPTSLGAGVAKTSIGTNTKPAQAANLIEFIPYYAPSGAVTAAQTMMLETALESASINLLPKRVINAPMQAGLGGTFATLIPQITAFECNTPLTKGGTEIIEVFGQAQLANTVAVIMGCALHYSETAPTRSAEHFYLKPDNETSTGTAATTVAGGTITINGGKTLQILMGALSAGTVTADEGYIGSLQFNSSNFDNSQDLEIPLQPTSVGIGALNSAQQVKHSIYKNVSMGMKATCTISTVLRLSQALTAAGNFIGCVGYTKA